MSFIRGVVHEPPAPAPEHPAGEEEMEEWRGIAVHLNHGENVVGKVHKVVKQADGTLVAELTVDDEIVRGGLLERANAGGLSIGTMSLEALEAQRREMYSKIKVLGLPCTNPAPNPEPLIREMLVREGIWPDPIQSRFAKITVPVREPTPDAAGEPEEEVREMLESTRIWGGADAQPIGKVTIYENPDLVPEEERYPDVLPRQLSDW